MVDLSKWEEDVDAAVTRTREAFEGKYSKEIKALLEMSPATIDAITPDTTGVKVYDQLVIVVKEASRHNVSQAELKNRIEKLGSAGVALAKRVATLAKLFI